MTDNDGVRRLLDTVRVERRKAGADELATIVMRVYHDYVASAVDGDPTMLALVKEGIEAVREFGGAPVPLSEPTLQSILAGGPLDPRITNQDATNLGFLGLQSLAIDEELSDRAN